jgi:ubiquinone biosynthesis protein UbiJ
VFNYFVKEAVQKFFDQAFKITPESFAVCDKHDGKVLNMVITQPDVIFWILVNKNRWVVYDTAPNTPPNATIKGSLRSIIKKNNIDIKGDIDFVQDVSFVITNFDIDWETLLSHYLGDEVTSVISSAVSKISKHTDVLKSNLIGTVKSCIENQKLLMVSQKDMDNFIKEVDNFDAKVERMEAKLNYLEEILIKEIASEKD